MEGNEIDHVLNHRTVARRALVNCAQQHNYNDCREEGAWHTKGVIRLVMIMIVIIIIPMIMIMMMWTSIMNQNEGTSSSTSTPTPTPTQLLVVE